MSSQTFRTGREPALEINLRLRKMRAAPLFLSLSRGCSSVVEHLVANENVEGSSPFTRSSFHLSSSQNVPCGTVGLDRRGTVC